ncbi:MAG: hypothetical protein H7A24_11200 [Leptospiraceae bacterium]|nr:hypothetical protein [Leptospiraceae bacterium]MCP5512440.1 hypothetical protein [Leptospiraceae bacterium]
MNPIPFLKGKTFFLNLIAKILPLMKFDDKGKLVHGYAGMELGVHFPIYHNGLIPAGGSG